MKSLLNAKWISRWVRVIVRRLLPYGSVRRVLRGPLLGYRFKVAPAMGLNYMLGGSHYPFDQFKGVLNEGMVVYDIGGNRGQMALFFASMVGAKGTVVSFEPVKKMADKIIENAALNDLKHLRVETLALAEVCGKSNFEFDLEHSTQGCLVRDVSPSSRHNIIEVTLMTLDAYVLTNDINPDLIKIDVEGGAKGVLSGGRELLKASRPVVMIELHNESEREAVAWCVQELDYVVVDAQKDPVSDVMSFSENIVWLFPREKMFDK